MKLKALLLLSLLLVIGACSDNDDISNSEAGRVYNYLRCIDNEDATTSVVLDSLSANVVSTSALPDWVTSVVQDSTTADGNHPVLSITYKGTDANETRDDAVITLSMSNGALVNLTLRMAYLYAYGDNSAANADFLSDWENQDKVTIFSSAIGSAGVEKQVATPWADVITTMLPDEVREDVKKEDGWSMAFCTLNDHLNANCNYFGLYNKYLGILRVFYYVEEIVGNASNYVFEVNMGSDKKTDNHSPYFNSLQYGIPVCHKNVTADAGMMLVGSQKTGNTFMSFSEPYTKSASGSINYGWTAFDIDMSAYSPSTNFFADNGKAFSFTCYSWSEGDITLAGSLKGNITGEYDEPTTTVTTSGIGTVVNALRTTGDIMQTYTDYVRDKVDITGETIGGGGDSGSGSGKTAPKVRETRSVVVAMLCATAAIKIGTLIYDNFFSDAGIDKTEYTRGKIDMNLTGTISLSGTIRQNQPNSIRPLTFKKTQITHDSESHFGEGIWSLQDDPVIYIVSDQCLANKKVNLYKDASHAYDVIDNATDYQLRMCQFFDPTSIKVNINKELFPDASNVKVEAFYGLYPSSAMGHTASFRAAVGIEAPDYINLVDHSKYATGDVIDGDNFKMKIHQRNIYPFNSNYFGETIQTSQFVEEGYTNNVAHCLYGYKEDYSSTSSFMPAPQVLFPVSADRTHIYDSPVPDYVVCVAVSFRSGGKNYVYSNRYIPKVVLVTTAEAKQKYNELQSYVSKCKAGTAIGTLNNDSETPVYHLHGAEFMQKDLDILKELINN